MKSAFRPNRLDVFASIAVVVTTVLFIGAALDAAGAYMSVRTMTPWEQTAGCFGWLIATFGPVTISIVFWRTSKHVRKAWILHLLMLPLAYALVRIGSSLMLFVVGDPDFDATIGGPVIQAGLLFGLAAIGYYSAVLYTVFKRRRRHSNGS